MVVIPIETTNLLRFLRTLQLSVDKNQTLRASLSWGWGSEVEWTWFRLLSLCLFGTFLCPRRN